MNDLLMAAPSAFDELAARHRRALHVHCYRMVGSFSDADDLVQDALLRAWNAQASYDASTGEVGFRRWLHRIATNVCLDFLKSAARRVIAASDWPSEAPWLEPYPDRLLDELVADGDPASAAIAKENIALGYLMLIQRLPPQQRAVLLLREVQGWSAAETASALDLSVAAVNSSLQRARDTVGRSSGAPAPTADERALLAAFIDAHERGDAAAVLAVAATDIRCTMPPMPHVFVGVDALTPLMERAFGGTMGDWRLVATAANRQPAAISYLRRPGDAQFRVFKIDVLRVAGDRIAEITTFNDELAAAFDAPAILPA